MTRSAFIIGGTGQIGRATAQCLLRAGWSVTVGHRRPADPPVTGVRSVPLDRSDTTALLAAARGHDLVLDTVAFTPEHADQLARLRGDVGSLVVISSGAVYLGGEDGAPVGLPDAVPEDWPTVDDGGASYGGGKAAMERTLLAAPGLPVSILRPGTLHGPHSTSLHQWSFIKPVLDRRPHVVLAYDGQSRFSTSADANVAELVRLCADRPGTRVLNAADEETPPVAEIGTRIFAEMSHQAEIITFPGPPRAGGLGFNPWGIPRPNVLGMARAREELGYVPVVSYAQALRADIDWAVRAVKQAEASGKTWHDVFPGLIARYGDACWFPYEAEDNYVKSRAKES
jgi:nucleoside-diphosphate-sugar epimerase